MHIKDKIFGLFPTPILKINIDRKLNEKEIDSIGRILKTCKKNSKNIVSNDNFIFRDYEGLNDLSNYIQKALDYFAKETLNLRDDQKIVITQSWLNLTLKNQEHHKHRHPNSIVSGVFYVNTIPKDGIMLHTPRVPTFDAGNFDKDMNHLYGEITKLRVVSGDLILFPSTLEHSVDLNTTDHNRISIAFNTQIKGKAGSHEHLTYVEY